MTTVEVLRAARARIDTPDKWTKHALARNARGIGVEPHDAEATSYCALGVIASVTEAVWEAKAAVCRAAGLPHPRIAGWNNAPDRTHADVLAAFDRAIAVEEARAQEFTAESVAEPGPVTA